MERINYIGDVYRPPSEARSLIIQATVGCSNNTCAFCRMYKAKRFYLRKIEDVLDDFRIARNMYPYVRRIFIADGDALIMPMDSWLKVLNCIKSLFPECERITCYASPVSVLKKTVEELKTLHENGLEMVYMGLESGNNEVLKLMGKGSSAEEMIACADKVHSAGIALSVTAINGLGGIQYSRQHAIDTGKVLSAMKPEYIGLLTLMLERPAPICDMVQNGVITPLSSDEILAEIKLMLQNCDSEGSVFRANHASNYLALGGVLNADTPRLIALIDSALQGKTNLRPEWMRGL